jgi:hypothetical protein
MDPITAAILAALAAGVVAGATEVGTKLIVDAYEALKAALKKKFGPDSKVVEAVNTLEKEPDFKPNQEALAGRVEQVKAAADPELVKLAQALVEALKTTAEGQQAVSKYHIQDSQVGVVGDKAHVEGGIHFGETKKR